MVGFVNPILTRVVGKVKSMNGIVLFAQVAAPQTNIECTDLISQAGIYQRVTGNLLVMIVAEVAVATPLKLESGTKARGEIYICTDVVLPAWCFCLVTVVYHTDG